MLEAHGEDPAVSGALVTCGQVGWEENGEMAVGVSHGKVTKCGRAASVESWGLQPHWGGFKERKGGRTWQAASLDIPPRSFKGRKGVGWHLEVLSFF